MADVGGGRGISGKSCNGFLLCLFFVLFLWLQDGRLLQQFVLSALLLRLCIIYDQDSKMLVNCSTRNNGM